MSTIKVYYTKICSKTLRIGVDCVIITLLCGFKITSRLRDTTAIQKSILEDNNLCNTHTK